MPFAITLYTISILLFVLGDFLLGQKSIFLVVPALFCFYVSITDFFIGSMYLFSAFFDVNPGRIMKNVDGTTNKTVLKLMGPFIYFEKKAWKKWREKGHEEIFEEVTKDLYIGSKLKEKDIKALQEEGISAVLDLVAEFDAPESIRNNPEIEYICIPVLDGSTPTLREFAQSAYFVSEAIKTGRKVLVHCIFGHGRSASSVVASLIVLGEAKDVKEAISIVKKTKRKIWINREQQSILNKFYKIFKQKQSA